MKKILPILLSCILLTTITSAQVQNRNFTQNPVSSRITCYPSPATSFITFDFQKNYQKGYSIKVFNFLGKKMYEGANLSKKTTIQLDRFTRGLYVYQLYDENGKMVETGKFQVSAS